MKSNLVDILQNATLLDVSLIIIFCSSLFGSIFKIVRSVLKPKEKNDAEHKRLEELVETKIQETRSENEKNIKKATEEIKNMLLDISLNNENREKTDALMLRIKIKELHYKYISRDFITSDELGVYKELLTTYWDLGYNHISKQYLIDVERLKVKPYGYD